MVAAPAYHIATATRTCHGQVAVIDRPGHVSLREMEWPAPGPGQVRIRLEGCGVCGSNVPVWEGRPWFNYPRETGSPGHEGWGVVDAIGGRVSHLRAGDRVAGLSFHAFATHDMADAEHVVRLPDELAGRPFPGEAVGCAVNVFRRSGLRSGDTVAVVGVGFLGALIIQLAAELGARVFALSRREFSLATARRCGAEEAICSERADAVEAVQELTRGGGCDCVIEATGLQEPLDLASKLVRTRGRLVIAGYHQDGLRSVDMQSWNWRGIDVINAHERDPQMYVRGMEEGARAAARGRIRLDELLTHQFTLSELGRALQAASERPQEFLKAWVRCT